MRTGVVDGVELTVHVEQGDLLSLHLDQLAVVRLKLVRLRYFDIFGHASLLDRSTFLGHAVLSGLVKTPDALSVPHVVRRNIGSPRGSRPIQPRGVLAADAGLSNYVIHCLAPPSPYGFSVYWYGATRELPSFPTRRSPDLSKWRTALQ